MKQYFKRYYTEFILNYKYPYLIWKQKMPHAVGIFTQTTPLTHYNTLRCITCKIRLLYNTDFIVLLKNKAWAFSEYILRLFQKCYILIWFQLQGVALETAPHGITCNAICPGFADAPSKNVLFRQIYFCSDYFICSLSTHNKRCFLASFSLCFNIMFYNTWTLYSSIRAMVVGWISSSTYDHKLYTKWIHASILCFQTFPQCRFHPVSSLYLFRFSSRIYLVVTL